MGRGASRNAITFRGLPHDERFFETAVLSDIHGTDGT